MDYHRFPLPGDMNTNLKSLNSVIISDCLTQDTIAVHRFQRKLIAYLKDHLPFEKVIYFSDGAASQYKNKKNFINLVYYEEDFGIPAEWHFLQHPIGMVHVLGSVARLSVWQQELVFNGYSSRSRKAYPLLYLSLYQKRK